MGKYMLVALMLAGGSLLAYDKVKSYDVICSTDNDGIVEAINEKIAQGWQPFGPIQVSDYTYCQTLVKHASSPTPVPTPYDAKSEDNPYLFEAANQVLKDYNSSTEYAVDGKIVGNWGYVESGPHALVDMFFKKNSKGKWELVYSGFWAMQGEKFEIKITDIPKELGKLSKWFDYEKPLDK